ncbi:hypothetical protein HMPREF3209_01635 [Lactobacillus crispatus]|nr:hypothetical protein HMPREF3209_01635 [Lactobacillus crispatus]
MERNMRFLSQKTLDQYQRSKLFNLIHNYHPLVTDEPPMIVKRFYTPEEEKQREMAQNQQRGNNMRSTNQRKNLRRRSMEDATDHRPQNNNFNNNFNTGNNQPPVSQSTQMGDALSEFMSSNNNFMDNNSNDLNNADNSGFPKMNSLPEPVNKPMNPRPAMKNNGGSFNQQQPQAQFNTPNTNAEQADGTPNMPQQNMYNAPQQQPEPEPTQPAPQQQPEPQETQAPTPTPQPEPEPQNQETEAPAPQPEPEPQTQETEAPASQPQEDETTSDTVVPADNSKEFAEDDETYQRITSAIKTRDFVERMNQIEIALNTNLKNLPCKRFNLIMLQNGAIQKVNGSIPHDQKFHMNLESGLFFQSFSRVVIGKYMDISLIPRVTVNNQTKPVKNLNICPESWTKDNKYKDLIIQGNYQYCYYNTDMEKFIESLKRFTFDVMDLGTAKIFELLQIPVMPD